VDKEGYRPYPLGLLNAEMVVDLSTVGPSGSGLKTKLITVSVEGDKYYPKNKLIEAAFTLANERLVTGDHVNRSRIRESTFAENSVTLSIEAQTTEGSNGRDSRYDIASSGLFRAIAATSGTRPAQGRFRQVGPYGVSLVRAAVQAMFFAPDDGSPANLNALAVADVDRYSRDTNLTDTDGDGYKEDFTEDSEVGGVDVTVAALPSDYDGTVLDIFLGDNDASGSGSGIASGGSGRSNPVPDGEHQRAKAGTQLQQGGACRRPGEAPENRAVASPRPRDDLQGELWRTGAAPEPFVPPELADTSRNFRLVTQDITYPQNRPLASGDAVEYGVRYLYVIETPYDPDDTTNWVPDQSVTYASTGAATLSVYKGGQAIGSPYQPQIDEAYAVDDIDPSITGGVYA
jgi:hypothetical protein